MHGGAEGHGEDLGCEVQDCVDVGRDNQIGDVLGRVSRGADDRDRRRRDRVCLLYTSNHDFSVSLCPASRVNTTCTGLGLPAQQCATVLVVTQ